MQLSDFNYFLPPELIAQEALSDRSASRLLHLDASQTPASISNKHFTDIIDLIGKDDLLIFNNTRVIPARLTGKKESGGKVEVMVERVLDDSRVIAHVRSNKSPKAGGQLILEDNLQATVTGRQDDLFEIEFSAESNVYELLEQHGHIPLPPYIEREDTEDDKERYQTVYAKETGAVAAPTAGLHFTKEILDSLKDKGVKTAEVTLHVGAGTFLPVRVNDLSRHVMHSEWLEVTQEVCEAIKECKTNGGRVIAVGTTTMRSLETAAKETGEIQPYKGETRLFIKPGFQFNVVDAMITNFHVPESTLLMLVSAFSGYDNIMTAYKHAVNEKYRFFSYGDSMFLEKQPD